MSLDMVRRFLLWSAILNYGFLIVWAVVALAPAGGLRLFYSRLFRISGERFDAINFAGIVFYKTAIFFFNLAPYVALRIVG